MQIRRNSEFLATEAVNTRHYEDQLLLHEEEAGFRRYAVSPARDHLQMQFELKQLLLGEPMVTTP